MDYNVVLTNLEGNEDLVSVTGTVNGSQAAVRAKTRDVGLPKGRLTELLANGKLDAGDLPKAVSNDLAGALVDAFLGKAKKAAPPDAIKVSR